MNITIWHEKNEGVLDLLRKNNAFIPQLSLVALLDDEIVGKPVQFCK